MANLNDVSVEYISLNFTTISDLEMKDLRSDNFKEILGQAIWHSRPGCCRCRCRRRWLGNKRSIAESLPRSPLKCIIGPKEVLQSNNLEQPCRLEDEMMLS